jgi:hypothetical protein
MLGEVGSEKGEVEAEMVVSKVEKFGRIRAHFCWKMRNGGRCGKRRRLRRGRGARTCQRRAGLLGRQGGETLRTVVVGCNGALVRQTRSRDLPVRFHSLHSMADQDDVLDSLPYYDDDLQKYPFLKDKVEEEIARELGKVPAELHPRVPPAVELLTVRKRDTTGCAENSLLRGSTE